MEKQHKCNKLYLLLLLFLCIGCLIAATGITYARYRSESKEELLFEVRESDQVLLGTIQTLQEKDTFVPLGDSEQLAWTVDAESGAASLTFAAANGSDGENYSLKDQAVKLRMLGSLNLAAAETLPELTVTYKSKKVNGDEVEKTVQGEISYLVEGTALYHTYGPGYLYIFYETTAEGKEELTWELPGGELSYVTFTIQTIEDASGISGLLQPVIITESIDN